MADWYTSFWVILDKDGPTGMGDSMKASDWTEWVEDKITRRTTDENLQTNVNLVKVVMTWGYPLKPSKTAHVEK